MYTSRCSKNQIPGIFWYNISNPLKLELLKLFPEVRLVFNKGRYLLYRQLADDYYIFEFALKARPGTWLINHLKQHDAFAKFGKNANKLLRDYDSELENVEVAAERQRKNLTENLARDLAYMARGRVSILV